ncbi:hypothetical protein M2316_001492 [Cellulosimicrobium cellulans]|nr:hypothetical protein [Cellulosimicrobium cellulans]
MMRYPLPDRFSVTGNDTSTLMCRYPDAGNADGGIVEIPRFLSVTRFPTPGVGNG